MPKGMRAKPPNEPYSAQLPLALLNALDTNHRISLYLIENLPAEAWRARLPDGKGRTIAAIVAHMHNVRVMWLKAAKADDIPGQLDRATVTPAQAARALESSRTVLLKLSRRALETDGRIKGFRPDVAGFIGYLIAHDAHHGDKSRCLPANSDTACRRRLCLACGSGVPAEFFLGSKAQFR